MIFVLLIRIFLILGDLSLSVMLYHHVLLYGTYVGEVVGKATRECGCCMTDVGIKCCVFFSERHSRNELVNLYTTLV